MDMIPFTNGSITLSQKTISLRDRLLCPIIPYVLIDFSASSKSINAIVSNGKRFMAYELLKRLQKRGNDEMIKKLMQAVIKNIAGANTNYYFAEIFSWKTTTKFIERPGCVEYIFVKPGRNGMIETDYCLERSFGRLNFLITIEKVQH
jgi:hypothetical protein